MSTETFGEAGSIVGNHFVPSVRHSHKPLHGMLWILSALLVILALLYGNAQQLSGRLPSKILATKPGLSLVAELNAHYLPTTDYDRHRLDLLSVEVARICHLPVFIDGMRVGNYAIAKNQLNDGMPRHSVSVPLMLGDTVALTGMPSCTKGRDTPDFIYRWMELDMLKINPDEVERTEDEPLDPNTND